MCKSKYVSSTFLFYGIKTNMYETKYISSMVIKQICMNLHMLVLPSCSMVLKSTCMNLHMLVLFACTMVIKQICMNLHMLVLPSYSMVLK